MAKKHKHQRLPNGKGRPKVNHERGPTPEAMEKRKMLAGEKGNPEKAWNALGVLREREIITQSQHNAGMHYASLRARCIGRADVRIPGNDPAGSGASDGTDPREVALHREFNDMRDELRRAGSRAFDAVQNVAVFDRLPRWALNTTPRPSDEAKRKALLDGLTAITPRDVRRAA